MRIGLFASSLLLIEGTDKPVTVEDLAAEARAASEDGLSGYWVPQQWDADPLAVIAHVAPLAPDIELVASVIPIHSRHPLITAQCAVTAQLCTGGRFTLGLGVGHRISLRDRWGCRFERPVDTLREYLQVVLPLMRKGSVEFGGEFFRCSAALHRFLPQPDTPVLIGAMGPRMLRLAGELAEGTITWMSGSVGLREHIVPTIRRAAADNDRPPPRIGAIVPVCVTTEPAKTRARLATQLSPYLVLPAYQDAVGRSAAADAGGVSLVGSHAEVSAAIDELADIGVTDLVAAPMPANDGEHEATRETLRLAACRHSTPIQPSV